MPRRTLRIIADAQVALGLLERDGAQYRNTPVADAFLSGKGPRDFAPFLRFLDRISYPAWLKLEDAVRSGQAQARFGGFSAEEQQIFSAGVEALTAAPANALPAAYDWTRHQRVLDVGGGTGSYLLALRRQHPALRCTLFELPGVEPVARERFSREPAGDQIEFVAGDCFKDPLPEGHDAVIVAAVIHVFRPERNIELLRRIRQRVQSGARLLLIDVWMNPEHTEPLMGALFAGEFLVIAGEGDVYSEAEARSWLDQTGWRYIEHRPLAMPMSILVTEAAS